MLAAGIFFLACWRTPAESSVELDALALRRTIEPRLPGLPHSSCPLVDGDIGLKAVCPRPDEEESKELVRATRSLRGAAGGERAGRSRHELVGKLLAAHSAAELAASLDQLTRRAQQVGREDNEVAAEALTDLAVAYLLRAETLGDGNDLLSAAEAARAALARRAAYPPALFNLALAYERLLLPNAAAGIWSRLLPLETEDGWAGEAEKHLARLQETLAAQGGAAAPERDLEAERKRAFDELLPRWAEAAGAAKAGQAERIEEELATIAALSRAGGDRLLEAALVSLRGGDRARLSRALRELGARQAALAREAKEACAPGLDRLEREFRDQGSSPLALAAVHLAASCAYRRLDYAAAEAQAARWQQEVAAAGFPSSAGSAAWMRGTVASAGGRYAAAEGLFREAIAHFEAAGEPRNVAAVKVRLANAKARAGDPAGAFRQLHGALRGVAGGGDRRALSVALQEAVLELGLSGRTELGLVFSEEIFESDISGAELAGACDARWLRCWLLGKSGRLAEAEQELAQLRAELAAATDPEARRHFELLALVAEAELYLESDPRRSAEASAAALAAYEQTLFDISPLDLHLHLGQALRRLGDASGAGDQLTRGMAYFTAQADENPEISTKVRLFDRAGKILEEKMQLELEQGNRQAAFASLEASRAHLLLDEMAAKSATLAEIQDALEPYDLLVLYLFLNDRPLAFRVTRESFELVSLAGSRAQLESKIDAWWTAAGGNEKNISEELYDLLLRPLAPAPEARLLISFPDELASLPWAALRDRDSGRRATEDHPILIVPSASAMLAIERRGQTLPSLTAAPALAVGDPAFDRRVAPQLATDLPGARAEAQAAAAAFPTLLLEGEAATGSAFLAAMASRPLVLYAGHAVADSEMPLATRLFFAPDAAFPTGELQARDFYRRALPDGALVILSGCETGGGYGSRVEGRLDLAHPFLASGAAQVMLTRRTVHDRPAQQFLRLFFDRLRAGGDPWEAFRAAQIASIENDSTKGELPTWAIYQLVGGRWMKKQGGAS